MTRVKTAPAWCPVSRGNSRFGAAPYTFSDLSFGVPGAIVQIAGTYDVKELLDFQGHLLLDASLADTTSGFKAVYGDNGSTPVQKAGRRFEAAHSALRHER